MEKEQTELHANDFFDCYIENAELHEGQADDQGRRSLNMKAEYRFLVGGSTMTHYHCLIKRDGTPNEDKSGVSEYTKLQERYGADLINLETYEVDNTKFKPNIIVRALLKEEQWKGKPQLRIDRIFDKGDRKSAVDKNELARRFGATLRAMSRPAAPTVSAPNAAPPKGAAKPATPSTPPKGKAASKGSKGAAPAAPEVPPSDLNECWNVFVTIPDNKVLDKDALENAWWEFLDETLGHRRQESVTPEQWGEVKKKLDEMAKVPF